MGSPMIVAIHMAKHDGRRGIEAQFMSVSHDFQPLLGVEFVSANFLPDIIVQHFGCGTGQGIEAGFYAFL